MSLNIAPAREEFCELATRGNLIPLICEFVADVETPISALAKVEDIGPCFLFESAEKTEQVGRYSFVGFDPILIFKSSGAETDPLGELQCAMANFKFVSPPNSSPFVGGAFGFIGYDLVRSLERVVPIHSCDDLKLPVMMFMIPGRLLIFDHRLRKLSVVVNAQVDGDADATYKQATEKLRDTIMRLGRPISLPPVGTGGITARPKLESNTTRQEFEQMVMQAKELIAAGDIFQVVLSQRFETDFTGRALELYRALRFGNPSPYMFYLKFDSDFAAIGSSPEMHIRVRDRVVEIRPIAGTRPRGRDLEEDEKFSRELLADPKERAEHVMLIDLGRNDLGRVAKFGSLRVTEQMTIERYSHVMHIVSHAVAILRDGCSAFDAIRATFPAGTVSGAPKIRAMQIIADLEKARRGFYSGIVGYFGFDGSHDGCIAIRSIVLKNGKAYLQTGAGIVADSEPAREHDECVNKVKAMLEAIAKAQN